MPKIPAEDVDARKGLWGSRTLHRVIVILVLAAILGVALTRSKPGRLDQAIAAATDYELLDGPAPGEAVDLGTLPATISDWMRLHSKGSTSPSSVSNVSEEGVTDLLRLGEEIVATCTLPRRVTVEIPHDAAPQLRFIEFFDVTKLLASIAQGDAPSVGLDERFDAVLAILHMSQALSERHLAGVFLGGVMLESARDGFDACLADGLVLAPAQRAELLGILENFDFKGAVSRAHRGAIALERTSQENGPLVQSSRWRRMTDRVMGRSFHDDALCLELAVATQRKLHGEESETGRATRLDLLAEVRGLNRASYRHSHLAAKLDHRVETAMGWQNNVLDWIIEVK